MTIMSVLKAAEASGQSGFFWAPYAVAGLALFLLFGSMFALVSFGKGRDHC